MSKQKFMKPFKNQTDLDAMIEEAYTELGGAVSKDKLRHQLIMLGVKDGKDKKKK